MKTKIMSIFFTILSLSFLNNALADEEKVLLDIVIDGAHTGASAVIMEPDDTPLEMGLANGILAYNISKLSSLPKNYPIRKAMFGMLKRLGILGAGIAVGDIIYEVDKEYLDESLPTTVLGKKLGIMTYDLFNDSSNVNQISRNEEKESQNISVTESKVTSVNVEQ